MNKKGKNKKGKVPNPVPSQEAKEVVGDIKEPVKPSEIIENVEEKIESVKEERVPEIVSEVIVPPVETKDEETPKKPKRNRGKKKKGKEDEFEDINLEEGPKESSVPPPVEEPKEVLEGEKEILDMPIVTPTARKKKNKKKNEDQKEDKPFPSDAEPIALPPITKDVVKEPEIIEAKQEITVQPELVEPEIKSSKKKNKKKKRNDSERSDKEDVSCTSAFQKLIEAKEESLETKLEENVPKNVIPSESEKVEPEILPPKDFQTPKPIIEKDIVIPTEILSVKDEVPEQIPAPEGKNKKKNKKDKKHIPKPEESRQKSEEPVSKPSEPILKPLLLPTEKEVPITKECVSKEVTEETAPLFPEETSPKPKAKIAKPVEKKRKGKQDSQPTESVPEEIAPEPAKIDISAPAQIILESFESKLPEKDIIAETEIKVTSQDVPTEVIRTPTPTPIEMKDTIMQEFEPLNITDKAVGKKRKKGPKVPKTPDVSFEILDPKIETETKIDTDVKPVAITNVPSAVESLPTKILDVPHIGESMPTIEQQVCVETKMSDVPFIDDAPTPTSKVTELSSLPGVKDHILLTPEFIQEINPMNIEPTVPEKAEDTLIFEVKSGKKRKKSPKPPKKVDVTPGSNEPVIEKVTEESLPQPEAVKEMGEKIDASNITKMYDIEISSIKADESEGSICDVVPDVTYPRASSQQLVDDNNNNTVIREIFPVKEITPDVFIQEPFEIPKDTIHTKGKEESSPPKEEKTDIKSKMMEVNQDMEDLRLSIERSLAELTAMEKSEEIVEKSFEETKIKSEENLKIAADVGTPKIKEEQVEKHIGIPTVEKSPIKKPIEIVKPIEITQDTTSKKHSEKPLFQAERIPFSEDKVTPEAMKTTQPEPIKEMQQKIKKEPKMKENVSTITTQEPQIKPTKIDSKVDPLMPVFIGEKKEGTVKKTEEIIAPQAVETKPLIEQQNIVETPIPLPPPPPFLPEDKKTEQTEIEKPTEIKPKEEVTQPDPPPVCPARKDHKGKHKKKKGKQDSQVAPSQPTQSSQSSTQSSTPTSTQETKKEEKTESKTENKGGKDTKEKGKQQASNLDTATEKDLFSDMDYEPIDNFEDALTSSVDDVNKTFEMIVKESQEQSNPKINIIAPDEEKPHVSPPKNLLGHPDIPVPSSRRDYKKEKDKIPNEITAKVKIKDAVDVERKQSKNTQTVNKLKELKDCRLSDNEDFVYKYNFRKVFLQSSCHLCKKELAGARVACCYCNLVFYCGIKHKDEDWPQHQALCFAVSTIGHLKDQKHIYGDAKNLTGHDYRLIRMQMIVSCEKVLKRRLVPWEQEALLYPRICAHVPCREWRQMKLSDCQGCGQISFCTEYPDHFPKSHLRWCKSYSLYQKLVCYQQTKGRLEPKLPTKVMRDQYQIPDKINEVLAGMYEEKIDMNDIQYAALTQLATAPLTAAYCYQLYRSKNNTANGFKASTFTIHVVGAELQFEADALNKWEVFFLHLRPDLQELRVVLINYNLNPSNLPLELLGKIKLCEQCRQDKRRVVFNFQDKRTYADYKSSEDFVVPDIVCAFNPNIQRSSVYNGKDPWPSAINVILKQKIPFIITGYTITELHKDCIRIKECSETGFNFISEPKYNNFASVRPDRNFISDDEMPLLFKNYCYAIICG